MAIIAEWKEYTILETGPYTAELSKIETVDTSFGPRWKWFWKVFNEDEEAVEISALSSQTFTIKSKAGQWTTMLLGNKRPPKGFNLEHLIGSVAKIHVEKIVKEDGSEFSNMKEVIKLLDNSNSFLPEEFKVEPEDDIPF